MDNIYLSVIIPAFNEEKRLSNTLTKVFHYLDSKDFKSEVVVVDDGSTDKTNEIASDFQKKRSNLTLLRNQKNSKKGYSVKRGVFHANGEYVLYSDADLSTPIEELEKFYKWIEEGYDVIIAARNLPESKKEIKQPIHREVGGYIYRKLNRLLFRHGLHDTQCGFKCFKKEVAQELFKRQTVFDFAFDIEILVLALLMGYTIHEVPVIWRNADHTRLNFVADSFRMLTSLLKIKLNFVLNRYSTDEDV